MTSLPVEWRHSHFIFNRPMLYLGCYSGYVPIFMEIGESSCPWEPKKGVKIALWLWRHSCGCDVIQNIEDGLRTLRRCPSTIMPSLKLIDWTVWTPSLWRPLRLNDVTHIFFNRPMFLFGNYSGHEPIFMEIGEFSCPWEPKKVSKLHYDVIPVGVTSFKILRID